MADKILVTGAAGQLGRSLKTLSPNNTDSVFLTREQLDITDKAAVIQTFQDIRPSIVINTAAYTAVDKAEKDETAAFQVNAEAVGYLAEACQLTGARLIHISTDYVFDGTQNTPYKESDPPNPINVYGKSKLAGELAALERNPATLILRVSGVYSPFKSNFVKTILKLASQGRSLTVVNDQVTCPTSAMSIAEVIFKIIPFVKSGAGGIYHYRDDTALSWYDFAVKILEAADISTNIRPIPSSQYPTLAKRPPYSILDITEIREAFHIKPANLDTALKNCITQLSGKVKREP